MTIGGLQMMSQAADVGQEVISTLRSGNQNAKALCCLGLCQLIKLGKKQELLLSSKSSDS